MEINCPSSGRQYSQCIGNVTIDKTWEEHLILLQEGGLLLIQEVTGGTSSSFAHILSVLIIAIAFYFQSYIT